MMPRAPNELGPMPTVGRMRTVDEAVVRAPLDDIFALAADVESWPRHLSHYRYVRFRERQATGGIVEMSANRPFGPLNWPTWWLSLMEVRDRSIRFRHIGGVTTHMDVEWSFAPVTGGTHVSVVHVWDGPPWPLIRTIAARAVIGPVFIHGIASRTVAGLARAAEQRQTSSPVPTGAQ
ncbi:MAG TPA: SRPBCC family protein [Gemmatimonadaceae bacterium]|nr:SRPBCC family protein [Gemmatimonadaceae bacterium]